MVKLDHRRLCNYANDEGLVPTYGRLYNWYAVTDSRNIAPAGWHVPTDEEWNTMLKSMGMIQSQLDHFGADGGEYGGPLKAKGTSYWHN